MLQGDFQTATGWISTEYCVKSKRINLTQSAVVVRDDVMDALVHLSLQAVRVAYSFEMASSDLSKSFADSLRSRPHAERPMGLRAGRMKFKLISPARNGRSSRPIRYQCRTCAR